MIEARTLSGQVPLIDHNDIVEMLLNLSEVREGGREGALQLTEQPAEKG